MTKARDLGNLGSDIGTAATEDVTTSATDTTAGRLLKVGDFGVGAGQQLLEADLDTLTTPATYSIASTSTNTPSPVIGVMVTVDGDIDVPIFDVVEPIVEDLV